MPKKSANQQKVAAEISVGCLCICNCSKLIAEQLHSFSVELQCDLSRAHILMASVSEIDRREVLSTKAADELNPLMSEATHVIDHLLDDLLKLSALSQSMAGTIAELLDSWGRVEDTTFLRFRSDMVDLLQTLKSIGPDIISQPTTWPEISPNSILTEMMPSLAGIAQSLAQVEFVQTMPMSLHLREWLERWQVLRAGLMNGGRR